MKKYLFILILLLSHLPLFSLSYGHRVLALYKSSEGQSEKENEVLFYLSGPLQEMGLEVSYWDIDRGIPDRRSLEGVRALITWFRGPAMSHPEAYLSFLEEAIYSGRKLVVFDNFGAYQDRKSGQYLQPGRLNLTLARLGIMYRGDWTGDPGLIRIAEKDLQMVEYEGRQDPAKARLYYRFIPHDRRLRVYLSLTRTDREYGPSPVIVTNRNGGFVLSRYIYRVEGDRVLMLLNAKRFLREALFPPPSEERIALLADPSDPTASRILGYARGVLRRAKLAFEVIERERLPHLLPGDLRRFTAVGLILRDDAGLDPAVLEEHLREGGGLVSLLGGRFRRLAPNLALAKPASSREEHSGYRFRYGFLLGEGLSLEERSLRWYSGANRPAEGVEVLAHDYDGDFPLLWTASRGGGKILIWNWDGFQTGSFQGFLLESFLYVRPVGIAATAGIGVMFIDDWPLPMYNVVKDPFDMTDTEFYTRVWWPEIKGLFDERDIPYVSYLIFNYNSITRPPFLGGEFFVGENLASVRVAREILASGRELALHGYNHMSVTEKDTKVNLASWPSKEAMKEALMAARREWISLFGEHSLPNAYVAPNNIISELGMEAVKEVFPSIKVISTLRSGTGEETRTEFGAHPRIRDLYLIPRTSSGYLFTDQVKQLIVSAATGAGALTHFIHPDDVYDPNRSRGLSWKEMKREFVRLLDFIERHYPWLRFVSIRQAHRALEEIDAAGASFLWQDGRLTIYSTPGLKLRVRLNGKKLERSEGLRILYRYERAQALILETTRPQAELGFRPD